MSELLPVPNHPGHYLALDGTPWGPQWQSSKLRPLPVQQSRQYGPCAMLWDGQRQTPLPIVDTHRELFGAENADCIRLPMRPTNA